MSWFRGKDRATTPKIPETNTYNRPDDNGIPDEYETNRRALFTPQQGEPRRGPSPSGRPPRGRYDEPDNEDEYAASRANLLRKGGPPPSAAAVAKEANSIRAMPDRYNRSGGPNDAYSRGVRDLDQDRANLFAGATVPAARSSGRSPAGAGGGQVQDEDEEDLEAIQTKTKDLKQQSVMSMREGLRMMREAEETGKNTLLKLGTQSGTVHLT